MDKKILVVVDSLCDLCPDFIREHDILVIPNKVRWDDRGFLDLRDPERTEAFYAHAAAHPSREVGMQAASAEEVDALLERGVVLQFSNIQIVTAALRYSPVHEATHQVVNQQTQRYKKLRHEAGIPWLFSLKVLDSMTLCAGEAVVVREAVRLIEEGGLGIGELNAALLELRKHVVTYAVPGDPELFNRATGEGGRMGWLSAQLGSLTRRRPLLRFQQGEFTVLERVTGLEQALSALFERFGPELAGSPVGSSIAMSYAGDLATIRALPEWQAFLSVAARRGQEVMLAPMGMSGTTLLGPGAFTLGLAAA